jgi:hypothetical protein
MQHHHRTLTEAERRAIITGQAESRHLRIKEIAEQQRGGVCPGSHLCWCAVPEREPLPAHQHGVIWLGAIGDSCLVWVEDRGRDAHC